MLVCGLFFFFLLHAWACRETHRTRGVRSCVRVHVHVTIKKKHLGGVIMGNDRRRLVSSRSNHSAATLSVESLRFSGDGSYSTARLFHQSLEKAELTSLRSVLDFVTNQRQRREAIKGRGRGRKRSVRHFRLSLGDSCC